MEKKRRKKNVSVQDIQQTEKQRSERTYGRMERRMDGFDERRMCLLSRDGVAQ